jgi:LCP family protein required for cell wall assembly
LQFLKSKPQNQKRNLQFTKSEPQNQSEKLQFTKSETLKQKVNLQFTKSEPQKPKINLQLPKSKIKIPKLMFKWNITSILGVLFVFFACMTMITTMVVLAQNFQRDQKVVAAKEEEFVPVVVTPNFDNQIKILLLGSDLRPNDGSYRTDAILMVVLDPELMQINIVSFPRDLWVQVPSLWEMKINQVFELGGFDAMAGMFEANFGIRPDYYVMTNFNGFTQFIDNRGGVDVNVGSDFSDQCNLPHKDINGDCFVDQGVVHMDGPMALWYVRARNTSNDLDRTRREQEVLYGLAKKLVSFQSLTQLSSMKSEIEENIDTNMNIEQAVQLMPFVAMVLNQPEKINQISIGEDQAYPMWSWNGMWILMPETELIKDLLIDAGIRLN